MPGYEHTPAEALPEECAGAADLFDDVGNADIWAQIISHQRDRDAARVYSARDIAVEGGIERTPPAAMDENRERRTFSRLRQE